MRALAKGGFAILISGHRTGDCRLSFRGPLGPSLTRLPYYVCSQRRYFKVNRIPRRGASAPARFRTSGVCRVFTGVIIGGLWSRSRSGIWGEVREMPAAAAARLGSRGRLRCGVCSLVGCGWLVFMEWPSEMGALDASGSLRFRGMGLLLFPPGLRRRSGLP